MPKLKLRIHYLCFYAPLAIIALVLLGYRQKYKNNMDPKVATTGLLFLQPANNGPRPTQSNSRAQLSTECSLKYTTSLLIQPIFSVHISYFKEQQTYYKQFQGFCFLPFNLSLFFLNYSQHSAEQLTWAVFVVFSVLSRASDSSATSGVASRFIVHCQRRCILWGHLVGDQVTRGSE